MNKFIGTGKVSKKAVLEWPVKLFRARVDDNTAIGAYTYLMNNTHVRPNCKIGRYCSIAKNVEIAPPEHPTDWLSSSTFQYNYFHFSPVEGFNEREVLNYTEMPGAIIGNDVWIGQNAIIRKGVTIGNGAIIGAGAFVNHDVPDYAIVGGLPAKHIRWRFEPETIEKLLELKWWELSPQQLDGVTFNHVDRAIEQIEAIKHNAQQSQITTKAAQNRS